MKNHLSLIVILISFTLFSQNPSSYANEIKAGELKEKLYTYASDEFQGRETGTEGQKIAVEYLKQSYQVLGVSSAKSDGNYFQNVPLKRIKTPKVSISIGGKAYSYYDDFVAVASGESKIIETNEFVYVGYGIKTTSYNDYENLDVNGKIVVAINGEPKDNNGTYIVSGTNEISKWSNGRQALSSKRNLAKELGATAFFLIDNNMFKRYSSYYEALEKRGGESNLALDVDSNSFYGFLGSKEMGMNLIKEKNGVYKQNISIEFENISEPIGSENVVAMIPGKEKPEEYIILSAHLDHVGMHDGEVFNGADDDGSGTVALLEIAEAFQKAVENGDGPKRSIVFLHVTGEEKGLLGSQYYTDYDPIVSLENTVANLNIDMIGRIDPKRKIGKRNYIYLIGSDKLSTELHELSELVNKQYTNIELDYTYNDENDPNRFYYRSDHYNFAKNNIPIIFYFNGTHADYHKATDTPDKIEYDLLQNRTQLVFYTAWELANREDRIVVDKASE
jgi:hypothetical protein